MKKKDLSELELFEKRRKRKLIFTPFLLIFAIAGVVTAATFLTGLAEELNVVIPYSLTVTRTRDQRTNTVADEILTKKIVRHINGLDLKPVYYNDGININYENAYYIEMRFEDEDGYEYTEVYVLSGIYLSVYKKEINGNYTIPREDADSLKALLDKSLGRQRDVFRNW